MNLPQGAVRLPPRKIIKDRTVGRQVCRNRSPLTPGTQHRSEPIEDFADIHGPLTAAPSRGGNPGGELAPLLLGHIAGIAQLVAVVTRTVLCRPHERPLLAALVESQPPLLIQELPERTLRNHTQTSDGMSCATPQCWES